MEKYFDEMALKCAEYVIESQDGYTTNLMRKFALGYSHAYAIMDLLEEIGIVGPKVGAGPRQVLVKDKALVTQDLRELKRVQLCSSIMRAKQNALNAVGLGDREKILVFTIDGYEFPDLIPGKDDSYDLNWLNIRVSFVDGSIHDEYIDACVLTWELDRIREGIDRLLKDEIDELDSDSMFLLTESTIYFTVRRAELGRYKVDINAKGHNVRTVISQDKLVQIRKQLALGQRLFPER